MWRCWRLDAGGGLQPLVPTRWQGSWWALVRQGCWSLCTCLRKRTGGWSVGRRRLVVDPCYLSFDVSRSQCALWVAASIPKFTLIYERGSSAQMFERRRWRPLSLLPKPQHFGPPRLDAPLIGRDDLGRRRAQREGAGNWGWVRGMSRGVREGGREGGNAQHVPTGASTGPPGLQEGRFRQPTRVP
jgi:hypothetical protein